MMVLKSLLRGWMVWLCLAVPGPLSAQNAAWVQIEARATLSQAEDRARAYAGNLGNVVGYRLRSGWYAIALGPFSAPLAPVELARLRAARVIPGDSFVSDGSNFRDQFWPIGAEAGARPLIVAPLGQDAETAALPLPEPSDETPAEARASERSLSRADREDIQRALQTNGVYTSRIDGSFGRGTRSAMAAWQAAEGFETTGILTTRQRNQLMDTYWDTVSALGLSPVYDAEAGIEISLPMAMVGFDAYEAPFARYKGFEDPAQVILISQAGDADTLQGLYDVLQTLEIVPLEGERQIGRGRFSITGESDRIRTRIEAVLTTDGVKGYGLVWPAEDRLGQQMVFEAMQSSFAPVKGVVLPDTAGDRSLQRLDLLAGLQIRRPEVSVSGFYVDGSGRVLTTANAVDACSRITIEGDTEASLAVVDDALGVALLEPQFLLSPLGIAQLQAEPPLLQSEIAVAGYSYGGVLGAPTISFGTLADLRGLDGEDGVSRLALATQPGDVGGPVLDNAGGVLGILMPRKEDTGRALPGDVQFAANAEAIAAFLAENGVVLAPPPEDQPLAPSDIALIGADMTVLVECWN